MNQDQDGAQCPNGCDLRGEEIPEESRSWYGGKTHYSRVLGLELPEVYDGVCLWSCPTCAVMWHRFEVGDYRRARVETFLAGAQWGTDVRG